MNLICTTLGMVMALSCTDPEHRHPAWATEAQATFLGEQVRQCLSATDKEPYPAWDPATQKCPLAPTGAVALARAAIAKAFPEILTWSQDALSLHRHAARTNLTVWYYRASFRPGTATGPEARRTPSLAVIVGLNGQVPEIRRRRMPHRHIHAEELKRRRADALRKRQTQAQTPKTGAELREYLRRYQMELIRAGGSNGPPLPIPLTKEMDAQLIKEGVLPPLPREPKKKPPETPAPRQ